MVESAFRKRESARVAKLVLDSPFTPLVSPSFFEGASDFDGWLGQARKYLTS
jgi:hypothetical protein